MHLHVGTTLLLAAAAFQRRPDAAQVVLCGCCTAGEKRGGKRPSKNKKWRAFASQQHLSPLTTPSLIRSTTHSLFELSSQLLDSNLEPAPGSFIVK